MAGEFAHADVGGELTEVEYHALLGHILDGQGRGDLIISNSAATGLVRLAFGTADSLLVAGTNDPEWSTLRWSGSNLGPSADADLLGLAADTLTVRGQVLAGGGATITPHVNGDDLVIDLGVTDSGLSILSTGTGSVYFGDAATASIGGVIYSHATNDLDLRAGGDIGLRVETDQDVHLSPVGTADAELEVSDGSTTGGGTIHRAASATHSLLELKSNVVYLNDVQELQAQALVDVLALRHVDFQYKRQLWTSGQPATYDKAGVEITPAVMPAFTGYEEPAPDAPLFRGLIYEDAPDSIREPAHSAIVVDRRVANLELAIQEVTRRVATLEVAP